MLADEPDLDLVRANDRAHEEVVRAVVAEASRFAGDGSRLDQDVFVRLEESLDSCTGTSSRPRGGASSRVSSATSLPMADRDASEELDALRQSVHEAGLLLGVLVEEQVKGIEARPPDTCQ